MILRQCLLVLSFFVFNPCSSDANDVCLKPKDSGQCRALKPYYFFNSETKRCELFAYGGCGGNGNAFRTLQECHDACKDHLVNPEDTSVHIKDPLCHLPPISSMRMCMAFFRKVTFNPRTLKCESYIYGGCGATKNLFNSMEDCRSSCTFGELKRSSTRPRGLSGASPRARSFSKPIGIESTETNICELPPVTPHLISCTAFMKKWTYDNKVGSCVEYIYGGCFGTKNLFKTKEDCEAKCLPPKFVELIPVETADVCGLPIEKGPCKALKFKYGFNTNTNRCEKFIYGGCQGNKNRFDSLEECVNLCGGTEPQETLDCSAAICDQQVAAFHKSKGCLPIVKEGECCPSSWDCSAWENRMLNLDKCFWANDEYPRGKFYEPGQNVPEASDEGSCRMGCTCTEGFADGADIICATPGCMWPGGHKQGEICKTLYRDLNTCCASETKCDDELSSLHQCTFENSTYYEGEKIRPKNDPCKVCLCNVAWTGETNDKQFCKTIDCGLNYQSASKLKKGCQPIYKEGVCCPISWVCPEEEKAVDPFLPEVVEPPPSTGAMVICPPGVSFRQGYNFDPPKPPKEPLGDSPVAQILPLPAVKASDVCLLPRTLGPCEGFQKAWYFDMEARKCFEFRTGGPGSGGNLFETEDACMEVCKEYALDDTNPECKYVVGDTSLSINPLIMCFNEHKSFRFNRKTGKCEDFVDWSCGIRPQGYASVDECEALCLPHVPREENLEKVVGKESRCNLDPVAGPCRSRLGRFYYDTTTGRCKKFWYGGCRGNENNFIDESDCISTCVVDAKLERAVQVQDLNVHSPCKQQGAVAGLCMAYIPRYYYDEEKKSCRIFFYGGCGGTDNNFATLRDCIATCKVDERAQKNHLEICSLPRQVGDCHKLETRYFFNPETSQCEAFEYTGCGKDEGSFKSLADCQLECSLPNNLKAMADLNPELQIELGLNEIEDSGSLDNEDPCLQDRVTGMCRAAMRRFYFDKESKTCKKFIYGGCGGNDNNFATLSQCEIRCARHLKVRKSAKRRLPVSNMSLEKLPTNPVCLLPVEVGPCEAFIPSYFFNTQTKHCEKFVYGGCRGNGNRFSSRDECESACQLPEGPNITAVVLPQPLEKCVLGDMYFNVGDLLRYGNNRCRTCKCVSPPGLTCLEKSCTKIQFTPTGNSLCKPTYDEDGCCETGYKCQPKLGESGDCSQRICATFGFVQPPDHSCTVISDGCCEGGVLCVPNP